MGFDRESPRGICGHQNSNGNWPGDRARLGWAGAENAFCGYVTPEHAIQGWMDSPDHRANLLDPNSHEIGLGYYRRDGDGRGYVTQDFGNDPVYAPVIIANEAISTLTPNVNLYIYDRATNGGFAGLDEATHMMVSNDNCFANAAWEPYAADKAWTLDGAQGWHSVYVKTRDVFDRTSISSDTIYLGANLPLNELGAAQMSTTQSEVLLNNLSGSGLPMAQFSLGWLADDPFLIFQFWRSSSADIYVDAVSIFTAPQAITSPLTWPVPGGNYRGQGVWVRYTDGDQFSAITEAATSQPLLHVYPTTLTFLAIRDGSPPPTSTLNVALDCSSSAWQAGSDAPWLQTQTSDSTVKVGVDQSGLNNGLHMGTVTISATGVSGVPQFPYQCA